MKSKVPTLPDVQTLIAAAGGGASSRMLAIGGWTCAPDYAENYVRFVTTYGTTGQTIRGNKQFIGDATEFVWPASRDGVEQPSKSYIKLLKGGVYEITVTGRMASDVSFWPNCGFELRYSMYNESGALKVNNEPISAAFGPYPTGQTYADRELSVIRLIPKINGMVTATTRIFVPAGYSISLSGAFYKPYPDSNVPQTNSDWAMLINGIGYDGEFFWQNSYRSSILIRRL